MQTKKTKDFRHMDLKKLLAENPFVTDEQLASRYSCSIQTIRLDRLELGVPELRERIKKVAEKRISNVKSVLDREFVGELIEISLSERAISVLDVTSELVSEKSGVCRGHHIFSQANLLAVALIDSDVVLTGSARIRYRRPVYIGERLVATAVLAKERNGKHLVKVVSRVGAEEVFVGKFIVVSR